MTLCKFKIKLLNYSREERQMANDENLIPNNQRTPSELREMARKGGIASGEKRRKKRTFRELMELYGAMPDPRFSERSNDESVVVAQYELAKSDKRGSTLAAAFIRDTKGEKPHDVLETPNIEYKPLVDLTKRKKNGENKQC